MNGKGQLRLGGKAMVSIGKRLTQSLGESIGGEQLEKMRRSLGVEAVQEWMSPPRLAEKPRQAIGLLLPYLEAAYLSYALGDALGLAVTLCHSWGIKSAKAKSWSVAQGRANSVMEKLAESGWAGNRRERPRFVDYERLVSSLAATPLRMGDENDTLVGVDAENKTVEVSDPKAAISVIDALLTGAAEVEIDLISLRNLCGLKRLPEAKLAETDGAREWVLAVPDLAPAVLVAAMEVFGYRENGGRNGGELGGWPNLDLRYVSDPATNFAIEAVKEMRKVLLTEDPMARAAIYWRFVSDPSTKGKAFTPEAASHLAQAWEVVTQQQEGKPGNTLPATADGATFDHAEVLARWDHLQKEAQAIQTDIVTGHLDTLQAMVTWWGKWKEGKRKMRAPMERERLGKRGGKAAEVPAVMTSKARVAGDIDAPEQSDPTEGTEPVAQPSGTPEQRLELERELGRASQYVGEAYQSKVDGNHYKVNSVAEYFDAPQFDVHVLLSKYSTESGCFSETPSCVATLADFETWLNSEQMVPLVSDAELEKSIEDGTPADVSSN